MNLPWNLNYSVDKLIVYAIEAWVQNHIGSYYTGVVDIVFYYALTSSLFPEK
jgi:hypothetical protein